MARVWIFGSRDWHSPAVVREAVFDLPPDTEVFVGGARGVDTIAERAASERGLRTTVVRAEWDTYGKRAGFIRNEKVARMVDEAIGFWDGQSRGTKHSIDLCEKRGIPLELVPERRNHRVVPAHLVDFYLPARRLLIEVDGGVHRGEAKRWKDRLRTEAIERARPNDKLVRVWNAEVEKDPAVALSRLLAA